MYSKIKKKGTALSALLTVLLFLVVLTPGSLMAQTYSENIQSSFAQGEYQNSDDLNPSLNNFFQFSIHNAYEKEGISLYEVLRDHSTNIEVDFYDTEDYFAWWPKYMSGDWYVRHNPFSFMGFFSNCENNDTQDKLSTCLTEIKRFHDDYPNHDLITLWIDKKQDWQPESQCTSGKNSPCRRPDDFDALMDRTLGTDFIYTPQDLAATYGSPRAAAESGHWPTRSELRGKIMIVITDHQNNNGNLRDYLDTRGNDARAFIAVKMSGGSVQTPSGMSGAENQVVFYNLSSSARNLGSEIYDRGLISRTWGTTSTDDYLPNYIQNGAGDDYTANWRYTGELLNP